MLTCRNRPIIIVGVGLTSDVFRDKIHDVYLRERIGSVAGRFLLDSRKNKMSTLQVAYSVSDLQCVLLSRPHP